MIDVRIRYTYPDGTAGIDHVVQPLLCRKTHDGNRSGNDRSLPVFHKFDVKQKAFSKSALQFGKLLSHTMRIEAALKVCVTLIGTNCPERRVVPRIVGKQRAGLEAGVSARESHGAAGLGRQLLKGIHLFRCDHEEE